MSRSPTTHELSHADVDTSSFLSSFNRPFLNTFFSMWPSIFSGKWSQMSQARNLIISALNCTVFISLDLLDSILCISYSFLDGFFEGHSSPCYCHRRGNEELSETLYRRKNVFRELGFLGSGRECGNLWETDGEVMGGSRWSDCGCESCLSWMNNNGDSGLHVRVLEPTQGNTFFFF